MQKTVDPFIQQELLYTSEQIENGLLQPSGPQRYTWRAFVNRYKPFLQIFLVIFCIQAIMAIDSCQCFTVDDILCSLSNNLLILIIVVSE